MTRRISRRISIAPMMDWTDRHCRYFLRLLTRHALLYTEMIHANAIVHGKAYRLLEYDLAEHPLALQLGGNDPTILAEAASIAADFGYDEINLNVGCPSDRVQSGQFGACLMLLPTLVRDCIEAMRSAVKIPVTVKCRIGIDRQESYEFLRTFVLTVLESGCDTFIIHARNAWLNGLNPKENRTIPPLRYDIVYRLKQEFPQLTIIINGGIVDYRGIDTHLQQVDGVMIGRAAYHNPYFLSEIDKRYNQTNEHVPTRIEVVERMLPYILQQREQGIFLKHITRHMLGLFHGQVGSRHFRRHLTEYAVDENAGIEVLKCAIQLLSA